MNKDVMCLCSKKATDASDRVSGFFGIAICSFICLLILLRVLEYVVEFLVSERLGVERFRCTVLCVLFRIGRSFESRCDSVFCFHVYATVPFFLDRSICHGIERCDRLSALTVSVSHWLRHEQSDEE